jgi:hypothetical protein
MARGSRQRDHHKKLASRLRRGARPQNSRNSGVRFEKGHAKRAGRKKGVPNRLTREIKEAIVAACEQHGSDGMGTGGLQGYLLLLAKEERQSMAMLLRAVMPLQVNTAVHPPKTYRSPDEIKAALKERGIPQVTIYRLEHHDPLEPANHSDLDPEAEEQKHGKKPD